MKFPTRWWAMLPFALLGAGAGGQDKPAVPFSPAYEDADHDCVCLSRDGTKLAIDYWSIWELRSGKKLVSGKTSGAHGMAFSPDGSLLAVCGNYSEFLIYDAHTGKTVWDLTLVGHGDTVIYQVEFTRDGKYLVSSSGNGMLRVWDVRRKKA